MNFRSRRRDDVDLNILPLIDVVFLLLIFFMVTTTFERDSEISITLPEASREAVQEQPEAIAIDIDQQGRVYINEQALDDAQSPTIRAALEAAVAEVDTGQEQPAIIISADEAATHQSVIKVMDIARQIGLRRITFATRVEQAE